MFGEKKEEFSAKQKKNVPVWQSPKYAETKRKAIEIMEKYPVIEEGDFWILMNETKSGKMAYTGLIISHNGCLKLNDVFPVKFDPECVTIDKEGFKGSLVYTYCSKEQGIYEVGEVSAENCKNAYPYAMAYKRLFDRVVLKLTKLAYSGIYSDSEAEEFKAPPIEEKPAPKKADTETIARIKQGLEETGSDVKRFLGVFHLESVDEINADQAERALAMIERKRGKN